MENTNIPTDRELPSTAKLIKSTAIAAATAAVLLVTVVMPAEYGIDPTGIGNIIGLKKMGEIRVSLAKEEAQQQTEAKPAQQEAIAQPDNSVIDTKPKQGEANAIAAPAPTQLAAGMLSHETQVTLAPNEGKEVKLDMSKGNKVQYTWVSSGGKVNYDVHADSKKLKIDYHKYSKGAEQNKTGELVAAFDGSHGWFWRNRTSSPVTITLKTKGEYTEIIQK
ncbi:transmembrane anchor protein [Chamaesiphon sp.]|uniref:transmembrane anchor protein n=1 Tax=Chamaesiphon sp. TaxID=2814140 RepID=UPI00359335A1